MPSTRNSRARLARRQRGFSMLEILVTMFLLSLWCSHLSWRCQMTSSAAVIAQRT